MAIASEIEESFYKLRPDFFKTVKAIPHSKILAGNMGIVNHERSIGGKTTIKFSPIICEQCSKEVKMYILPSPLLTTMCLLADSLVGARGVRSGILHR